jgi:hypothetical protein
VSEDHPSGLRPSGLARSDSCFLLLLKHDNPTALRTAEYSPSCRSAAPNPSCRARIAGRNGALRHRWARALGPRLPSAPANVPGCTGHDRRKLSGVSLSVLERAGLQYRGGPAARSLNSWEGEESRSLECGGRVQCTGGTARASISPGGYWPRCLAGARPRARREPAREGSRAALPVASTTSASSYGEFSRERTLTSNGAQSDKWDAGSAGIH